MSRLRNSLLVGLGALSLSLAGALSASAAALPDGTARTDVKIQPGARIEMKETGPSVPPPLSERSLASAHVVEVHPHEERPDTADTHTSNAQSK
jgi:hypothetical protein